jgi:hypothetical protein
MYAVDVAPDVISTVTDAVVADVTAWPQRARYATVPHLQEGRLPMAGHRAILDSGRAFTDGDRTDDLPTRLAGRRCLPRVSERRPRRKCESSSRLRTPRLWTNRMR